MNALLGHAVHQQMEAFEHDGTNLGSLALRFANRGEGPLTTQKLDVDPFHNLAAHPAAISVLRSDRAPHGFLQHTAWSGTAHESDPLLPVPNHANIRPYGRSIEFAKSLLVSLRPSHSSDFMTPSLNSTT